MVSLCASTCLVYLLRGEDLSITVTIWRNNNIQKLLSWSTIWNSFSVPNSSSGCSYAHNSFFAFSFLVHSSLWSRARRGHRSSEEELYLKKYYFDQHNVYAQWRYRFLYMSSIIWGMVSFSTFSPCRPDPSAFERLFRIIEYFSLWPENVTALFGGYSGLLICMESIHQTFC